jgi:alkyl hydroperoxide reductase subunit AhpC
MAVVYETILDVGDEVPGFDLESHLGRIVFRDIVYGRWCLLVTIDSAFEPVATTDLGMLARLKEEFDHREIFILVISSDTSKPDFLFWLWSL